MVLEKDEYKIIIQPEKSIIVNKIDKEEELAKLQVNLKEVADDIQHEDKEYELWKNEQLEKRRAMYLERIRETQEILDKING